MTDRSPGDPGGPTSPSQPRNLWALALLSEPERRDFCGICEDRYQVRSTILTSHCLSLGGTNR